jgi:hypothetical protein
MGNTYVLENLVPCLTTFSTASRKSRSEATFRRARMANMPACKWIEVIISGRNSRMERRKQTSVATERSSAPVVLGHRRAMRSNRMSRSTLILNTSVSECKGEYQDTKTKQKSTFVREFGEYVHDPHYRVTKTLLVGQDGQAAGVQDQAYQVCHISINILSHNPCNIDLTDSLP